MGLGGALIMPTTLSILVNVFGDPRERAKAIAAWTAASGAGIAVGPIIGGALMRSFSWSSVFWINVPLLVVALVGAVHLVPDSRDPHATRLDPIGAVLSIAAVSSLVYAVIFAAPLMVARLMGAQRDLEAIELTGGGHPEMVATYLVGDSLAVGPGDPQGYSVFYVADYETARGYSPVYTEVHDYRSDGKLAPRLVDYLNWDEQEGPEILLEVFRRGGGHSCGPGQQGLKLQRTAATRSSRRLVHRQAKVPCPPLTRERGRTTKGATRVNFPTQPISRKGFNGGTAQT